MSALYFLFCTQRVRQFSAAQTWKTAFAAMNAFSWHSSASLITCRRADRLRRTRTLTSPLESRNARLAAEACSHKSAKRRRILKLPISGWVTTVASSRQNRGRSVSFIPGPHTLPVEGSANHFSEACPLTTFYFGQNILLQLSTDKLNHTRGTHLI
jgi:hypothetical protein